ncbi:MULTISPECIES: methyl-accepting chemotaxis protein [Gordonibacter]|uniref:Methyl-accepting chemotaxis protein n=2 Tax=Gordonibacter TaxID=644652 RepID=A0ABT7DJT0_9ACTN|nr:methyl-accepting chemotaxis protein [Gordonibacter sp. KGMB12511]MDJ1649781.1 methyl-accepting chemotaxis protein [Gordonibacter sp. KGMB12511]HIW75446.1 MCP four helix bundle domain-containing protein [Candidatus Gordonibacter avicola]
MKQRFKNMSIGTMIMLSYVVVMVLFITSAGVAFYAIHSNAAMTSEFYQRPFQVTKSSMQLRSAIEQTANCLGQLVDESASAQQTKNLAAIEQYSEARNQEFAFISNTFTADPALLERFSEANDKLVAVRDKVLTAVKQGDYERASNLYTDDYLPQKETTSGLADDIVDTANSVATTFVQTSQELEIKTVVIVGVGALITLLLVVLMWRALARAITKPTLAMQAAAQRIAQGDLTASVEYESENELGAVAASINQTARSLHNTLDKIGEAVEQVTRSSSQMSDGAQSIAQGSAEQAMSIEELATNVQNIDQVVSENTESVLVANNSTTDVLAAVADGNDHITRTAQIIDQIKRNTENISQLANNIEDISFQTNILALNASVEAARAGEAGRGFSIVAEEIRRLAAQVSDASKEADTLADHTISGIQTSSAMIDEAVRNMTGAVEATENVKAMMSSIAETSTQQQEAVAQIRESMDRLSDVVQENSASAEESAVIAEELSSQAEELQHLMDRFNRGEDEHAR